MLQRVAQRGAILFFFVAEHRRLVPESDRITVGVAEFSAVPPKRHSLAGGQTRGRAPRVHGVCRRRYRIERSVSNPAPEMKAFPSLESILRLRLRIILPDPPQYSQTP